MKVLVLIAGMGLLSAVPATWLAPDIAARAYGIPADTDQALGYLRATAIRDLALGCWLLSMLVISTSQRIVAVSLFSIAIVALGDAINVFLNSGWNSPSIILHAGGHLFLVALGAQLWRTSSKVPPTTSSKVPPTVQ